MKYCEESLLAVLAMLVTAQNVSGFTMPASKAVSLSNSLSSIGSLNMVASNDIVNASEETSPVNGQKRKKTKQVSL